MFYFILIIYFLVIFFH